MLVTPEILVIEIRRRFEPFVDCSLFTLLSGAVYVQLPSKIRSLIFIKP